MIYLLFLVVFALGIYAMLPDDGMYEGEVNEEGLRHGKGNVTYSNGTVYVGQWENGLMHGKGMVRHIDNSWYQGDWKEGRIEGAGVWKDG